MAIPIFIHECVISTTKIECMSGDSVGSTSQPRKVTTANMSACLRIVISLSGYVELEDKNDAVKGKIKAVQWELT